MIVSADAGDGVDLFLGAHVTGLNDFNGDGHSDFLFSNTSNGVFSTWNISGNTTASHLDRTVLSGQVDTAYQVQGTFDINGDGVSDLVWRNLSTGLFSVWLGVGTSFVANTYTASVSSSYAMAGFGDLNGDGKDDILFRNTSTGVFTEWQSNGGGFTQNVYVNGSVDTSYHIQSIGDFDGDGKGDILWRNTSGFLTVWSSTGSGFTPNTSMIGGVDTTWHVAATADFNGDGKEDVLFRSDSGVFTEWQSTGAGFSQNVYVNGGVDNSWRLQGAFDFNDDGKADLLWRSESGTLTIWQSTGTGFLPNVLVDGSVASAYAIVSHHYDVVWPFTAWGEAQRSLVVRRASASSAEQSSTRGFPELAVPSAVGAACTHRPVFQGALTAGGLSRACAIDPSRIMACLVLRARAASDIREAASAMKSRSASGVWKKRLGSAIALL